MVDDLGQVTEFSETNNTALWGFANLAARNSVVAPTARGPASVASGANYAISWIETSPIGTYELQEATEPTFASPVAIVASSPVAHYQHATSAATTYYYRVQAFDLCSGITYRSAWSPTVFVAVQPPDVIFKNGFE